MRFGISIVNTPRQFACAARLRSEIPDESFVLVWFGDH